MTHGVGMEALSPLCDTNSHSKSLTGVRALLLCLYAFAPIRFFWTGAVAQ